MISEDGHNSDIGFLMAQTLFGEACGVAALKRLRTMLKSQAFRDNDIFQSENLDLQIGDEVRHAIIYRNILNSKKYGKGHVISRHWRLIFARVQSQEDPFNIISMIHLLIEPFNKIVIEDLIINSLSVDDATQVSKIVKDEENHISIGNELVLLCKGWEIDRPSLEKFRQEISFFNSTHADGIINPNTGTIFKISRRAKVKFAEYLNESFKLVSGNI
jgi:hypothetical protein